MLFLLVSVPGSCLEAGVELDVAMTSRGTKRLLPRAGVWDVLLHRQALNW